MNQVLNGVIWIWLEYGIGMLIVYFTHIYSACKVFTMFFELRSLGFIVEKKIPNNINAFIEIERGKIFDLNSENIKPGDYTLDNVSFFPILTFFAQKLVD
jgi:hypothetical protein